MKRLLFCLLLAVFPFTFVSAQSEVSIREIHEYMSQGKQPGFEVAVPGVAPKEVADGWKKYVKKSKAKVQTSRKSVEMFADNAYLPEVSPNTVDIYTIAREAAHGTTFTAYVNLGGAFLSSQGHPAAFGAFQSYLREFVLSQTLEGVEDELKTQEKVLKDLNKDLTGLMKDKDDYLKEIEKAKATIAEMESEIVRNEQEQEIKRQQIATQEAIISTIRQQKSVLEFKKK